MVFFAVGLMTRFFLAFAALFFVAVLLAAARLLGARRVVVTFLLAVAFDVDPFLLFFLAAMDEV